MTELTIRNGISALSAILLMPVVCAGHGVASRPRARMIVACLQVSALNSAAGVASSSVV